VKAKAETTTEASTPTRPTMRIRIRSKCGRPFWRLGRELSPDEWTVVELVEEARRRETTPEAILVGLLKATKPVLPRYSIESGSRKPVPGTGGGAIDVDPVDDAARALVERIRASRGRL
jgi:hypothetical protein